MTSKSMRYRNDDVGIWYFKINQALVVSPFFCSGGGSPGIYDNSTWRIIVQNPEPPSITCGSSRIVNKTAKIPIGKISKPLKSYTCHLKAMNSSPQSQAYPCQLENDNRTLALETFSDDFANKAFVLTISLEDIYGLSTKNSRCTTFYVDMEPPSITLDTSAVPQKIGLEDRYMTMTCTDNSHEKNPAAKSYGNTACTFYYRVQKGKIDSEQLWTKLEEAENRKHTSLRYLYQFSDVNVNESMYNGSGTYHLEIKAKDGAGNLSPVVKYSVFVDADYPVIRGIENKTLDCSKPNATSIQTSGDAVVIDATSNVTLVEYKDSIWNVSALVRTWTAKDSVNNTVIVSQYLRFPNDTLDIKLHDTIHDNIIHIPCDKAYKFKLVSQSGSSTQHEEHINQVPLYGYDDATGELLIQITDNCQARDFFIKHSDLQQGQNWKCSQQRFSLLQVFMKVTAGFYWKVNNGDFDMQFNLTVFIGPMTPIYPVNGEAEIDPGKPINFQWNSHPDSVKKVQFYLWQAGTSKPSEPTYTKIGRQRATYSYPAVAPGDPMNFLYQNTSLLKHSQGYNWQVILILYGNNSNDTGPVWHFSTKAELCIGSCSGNGICIGENQCQCYPRFTGEKCDLCSAGYWGPTCQKCPVCVNGVCNEENGTCICNDTKWTGDMCNDCSVGRIGANCEKLPFTTEIYPNSGPDTGGTLVHIKGYNFDSTAAYKCKFGSVEVSAKAVSSSLIECTSPQQSTQLVAVSVSNVQSTTKGEFLYVALCSSDCGANSNPKRGSCAFGRCICEKLWLGENCETPVVKPKFTIQSPDEVKEFEEITIQIKIIEGTNPITLKNSKVPKTAVFNVSSGRIRIKARNTPFLVFDIVATNRAGDTSEKLNLSVIPSYKVKTVKIDEDHVVPAPKAVKISGEVEISAGHQVPNVPAVSVIVRVSNSKGKITKIRALVKLALNERGFTATYIPSQTDIGKYIADAVHPFHENNAVVEMASWTVLGLTVSPGRVVVHSFIDNLSNGQKICSVTNGGPEKLSDITWELFSSLPSGVKVMLSTNADKSSSNNNKIQSLDPGGSFDLHLFVISDLPVQGDVVFLLSSYEGVKKYLTVQLRTKAKSSILQLNPRYVNLAVARGSPKVVSVLVSNVGSLPAFNITAKKPDSTEFLSITAIGQKLLEIGESSTITIRLFFPENEALGKRSGNIVVKSNDYQVRLPFTITITSDNKLDLRILVEDEYTYFREDKPPLSGAKVHVWGVDRIATSFSGKKETGVDGLAIFPQINEGFYNLQVSVENHESFTEVALFSPTARNKTVFLKRQKVKVKFVVKYTPITDQYVIELESSFETSVPMPVVIIKPQQVDLLSLEEGRVDRVDFKVTNYGLIQVTNVKLDFYTEHPFLEFVSDDEIAVLPANSTYILPMVVKVKKRTKRSSSSSCYIPFRLEYQYICQETRVELIDAVFSKSCPSPPRTDDLQPPRTPRIRTTPCTYCGGDVPVGPVGKYVFEAVTDLDFCGLWDCGKSVLKCVAKRNPVTCVLYNLLLEKPSATHAIKECLDFKKAFGKFIKRLPIPKSVKDKLTGPQKPRDKLDVKSKGKGKVRGGADSGKKSGKGKGGAGDSGQKKKKKNENDYCVEDIAKACMPVACDIFVNPILDPDNEVDCTIVSKDPKKKDEKRRKKRDASASEIALRKVVLAISAVKVLEFSESAIFGEKKYIGKVQFVKDAIGVTPDDLSDNYQFLMAMMEVEFKSVGNDAWAPAFFQAVADSSELGNFLSKDEETVLTSLAKTIPDKSEPLIEFLKAWNHSMEFWKLGKEFAEDSAVEIWDPSTITSLRNSVRAAITEANKLGHASIAEWASAEYNDFVEYQQQEDEQGVCAVVRVKISQKAVLIRDAFTAILEIENGQTTALENVLVKIRIWRAGDILKISQIEHFAVGSPKLAGIGSVGGSSGSNLPASTSASAEWLIIPRQTAVSEGEEKFFVGGFIEYSQNGLKTDVDLTPGQIVVKAQPLLQLHYFHEKYIYGDDPFTNDVAEESVPFVLAVMVINKGNGTAKSLKITSAQPEIIENEKGLLIDFEIVGSQVGLQETEKSLTVDFGDVPPRGVRVAQWLLTSSLNGQFFNFSASFVNINPLGDESLSLIESVSYHELTHVIEKLSNLNKNFYGDFLVNDETDSLYYPDTIFETLNGSAVAVDKLFTGNATVSNLRITINFEKPQRFEANKWFYGRAIIAKSSCPPRNYVPASFTDEAGNSKPLRNVWVTYSVKKKDPWISVVDFLVNNQRPDCCSYSVEFVPAGMAPTTTTSTTTTATTASTTTSTPMIFTTTLSSSSTTTSKPVSTSTQEPKTETTTTSSVPTSTPRVTPITTSTHRPTVQTTITPVTSEPISGSSTTSKTPSTISTWVPFTSTTMKASGGATTSSSLVTSSTSPSTMGTTTAASGLTTKPATSTTASPTVTTTGSAQKLTTTNAGGVQTLSPKAASTSPSGITTPTSTQLVTSAQALTVSIISESAEVNQPNIVTVNINWGTHTPKRVDSIRIWAHKNTRYLVNGRRSNSRRRVTIHSPNISNEGSTRLKLKILNAKADIYNFTMTIKIPQLSAIKADFSIKQFPVIRVASLRVKTVGKLREACVRLGRTRVKVQALLSVKDRAQFKRRRVYPRNKIVVQENTNNNFTTTNRAVKADLDFILSIGEVGDNDNKLPYELKLNITHKTGAKFSTVSKGGFTACESRTVRDMNKIWQELMNGTNDFWNWLLSI